MNLRPHLLLNIIVIIGFIACGETDKGTDMPLELDMSRMISDVYVTPTLDFGLIADAALQDDMGPRPPVNDCPSLCERLNTCDSTLLGTGSECVERCATLESYEGYDNFLGCVATADCNLLGQCIIPEPPPPSCIEVCESLTACDSAPRLPAGFEGINDCADACNDNESAQVIVLCGRGIAEGSSECIGENFSRCVAERLEPTCDEVCIRKLECGTADDYFDCVVDCARPIESEDPVTERRARLNQTCWQFAQDCTAALACDESATPTQYNSELLCQANLMCQSIDEPCEDTIADLSNVLSHDTLDCAADILTRSCDESLEQCFITPLDPIACDEYCAVAALCEQLPDELTEFECASECRGAADGLDELSGLYRSKLGCAFVNTCEQFELCLSARASDALCDRACDHIVACSDVGISQETCATECNEANSLRQDVFFGCNALINSCANTQQCAVPPAPNCATICEPSMACGIADETCDQRCDDRAFLNPDNFVIEYACHALARNCADTTLCATSEMPAPQNGGACLQYCRGRLACGGSQADMLSCIDECAQGLNGQEGLDFEQNFECLNQLSIDATCDEVAACNTVSTPEAICDTVCTAQQRCTLLEEGQSIQDCMAGCIDSVEATPDALACALRASRVTNGCLDLASCLDIQVEAAAPDCVDFCAAQVRCTDDADQFLCERTCDPNAADLPLRLNCLDLYSDCSDVSLCVEAEIEDPVLCANICQALNQCEGSIGDSGRFESIENCEIACGIEALINDEIDHNEVLTCFEEATCSEEDITRCLAGGRAAPTCDNAWTAYEECGNDSNFLWTLLGVTDRASYLSFCQGLIMTDGQATVERRIECLIDAAATMMCDVQISTCPSL